AKLVQTLIDEQLGARGAGIAATVHSFQGSERAAMLIDLTDSIGAKLGRFLEATHLQSEGARLLNVAISRARHHCVLVANFEYLHRQAPAGGFTRRLLEYFKEHGEALASESLLPVAGRGGVDRSLEPLSTSLHQTEGTPGTFFDQDTFYPAFLKDL